MKNIKRPKRYPAKLASGFSGVETTVTGGPGSGSAYPAGTASGADGSSGQVLPGSPGNYVSATGSRFACDNVVFFLIQNFGKRKFHKKMRFFT